jgi:phosphatidate phosphatase LPIN
MTDLVDQMFPPIHRKWTPEFTDFNYWKMPVQEFTLPDLSPPSPALSARSDTSNQSTLARIRNFSLVGNRQSNNMKNHSLPAPATEGSTPIPGINGKNTHLRQMSSLERLSNTLTALTLSSSSSVGDSRISLSLASRSSLSLSYADSGSEDEDGDDTSENGGERKGRRRSRAKSEASMPGSLDEMRFGDDDGESDYMDGVDMEGGYGYESEGEVEDGPENEEEAAEEAFDEDFFATGEMKNVPFL